MSNSNSVYDTDLHFEIDVVTRTISNQTLLKTRLMQYDHNSERLSFEIPRYIDGHDILLCNQVRVHYINAESTKQQSKGVYPVDDMQVSPASDDFVIFSWLISQNATVYPGTLTFLIQFSLVQDDGTIDYSWHTDAFKGISVSAGMANGEPIVQQYADILAQWEQELHEAIPVKGVDYFTDEEKAAIVEEVIAALPRYNGEVEDVS